ncbi:MAG: hypothetical protein ABJO67_07795 [Pseudoruegeria sp.]
MQSPFTTSCDFMRWPIGLATALELGLFNGELINLAINASAPEFESVNGIGVKTLSLDTVKDDLNYDAATRYLGGKQRDLFDPT